MASVSLMHEAGHSKPVALGQPREMRWGGRWEWDSGWGIHVEPWLIHVNAWQHYHNIVK